MNKINPISYFPNPADGRPVSGGKLFIGIPDTDPEIVANQKTVYALQEDGSYVPIAQPIYLSPGGTPVLNGDNITLYISGDYSIKVKTFSGVQVFYIPNISASGIGLHENLAAMKAASVISGATYYLQGRTTAGDGGEGIFLWDESDLSTQVAADTQSGVYVAPDSDATGASGAWVRQFDDTVMLAWFGAKLNGVTDDTVSTQAAIDFAKGLYRVSAGAGTLLITDTLHLYKGSNFSGINSSQGHASYSSGFTGSKILFNPTVTADLFVVDDLPLPAQPFKGNVAVSGFFIDGDSAEARYAFSLDTVIYGSFKDLEIRYFEAGFNCINTINNKFENIRITDSSVASVKYSGASPPTTDVWTQCTFTDAPVGVQISTGISLRFVNCLLENLDDYGVDIAKEGAVVQWIGGYGENVPLVNASGSMFRVGYTGSISSVSTVLQITGGKYQGNNTTIQGSFVDVDDADGVQLVGTYAQRFTNVIKTTANTANWAVSCSGVQYLTCPTFATDDTKISGFIDFQAINAGTGPVGYFAALNAGGNPVQYTSPSTAWTPSFSSSVGSFGSLTYTTQSGQYTRIDDMVIATFNIVVNSVTIGTAAGALQVSGLPFTFAEGTGTTTFHENFVTHGPDFLQYSGVGVDLLCRYKTATDYTNVPPTDLKAGTSLQGSIVYFIN